MAYTNRISFGEIVAIIGLQSGVSFMFLNFGYFVTQLQSSLAGSKRVLELLDIEAERTTGVTDYKKNKQKDIVIKMEGVSFGYNDNIFMKKLNLEITKGDIIAFVGTSGGGKSTIIKILLGLYKPIEGRIWFEGKPSESYTLKELRNMIAYVPQEPYIFNGTIMENILYGNIAASFEDVITAAERAGANEFIKKLPNGYDTIIGAKGIDLSGGQKQRIAIARALLKNSPIIIFDEATSALDYETEHELQKVLSNIIKDKTVIFIAHRLSTIKYTNVIYVFDKGQIVEKGTHDELIKQQGKYYYLNSFNEKSINYN
jgi:ABC-type multidrug transport system fused ATPase/permease subunit